MASAELLACPDCDLIQTAPPLAAGALAHCPRCEAVVARGLPDDRQRCLALTVAAAMLLVLANAYPILTLETRGVSASCTLLDAVQRLIEDDFHAIAALVFATTLLLPALEIVMLLTVLLRDPPPPVVLRWMERIRPWAMIDVFVLGLLVCLKKLADLARLEAGIALFAFCALMLVFAAIRANFDTHAHWARVPLDHAHD